MTSLRRQGIWGFTIYCLLAASPLILFVLTPTGTPASHSRFVLTSVIVLVAVFDVGVLQLTISSLRLFIQSSDSRINLVALSVLCVGPIVCLVGIFSIACWFYSHASPGSFNLLLSKPASVYFVVTTLTTTGYGDIFPKNGTAQVLVASEQIAGLLLIGVVLAACLSRALSGDAKIEKDILS